MRALLNNYYHSKGDFRLEIEGRPFSVRGVYYAQQNSLTGVCAHASLRMVLRTLDPTDGSLTDQGINQILGLVPPFPAGFGLTLQQIQTVLATKGLKPFGYSYRAQSPEDFDRALYSIIESGYPALLGFSTGTAAHIMPVYGHTLNTDEWHPEARPAYTGPTVALYHSSSAWVDHFLIHDDNFGPYYCLAKSSIHASPLQPADVVGLLPQAVAVAPMIAEAIAGFVLGQAPTLCSGLTAPWPTYLKEQNRIFVLRTLLMNRETYRKHLLDSVAHDGSALAAASLHDLARLPDLFWMCEFSLPSLYTGNKSKLGEVLVSATSPVDRRDLLRSVQALRVPGRFFLRQGQHLTPAACGLVAHSPLFRHFDRDHEW